MRQTKVAPQQADYGLDAPGVIGIAGLIGGSGVVLGSIAFGTLRSRAPRLATALLGVGGYAGFWGLGVFGMMLWSSKIGKLRERARLLQTLTLRGDEAVLDVGCGRGLLLNGIAQHLTTGKAVGIDTWQARDQSGNRPETTQANARAEGVSERVEIRRGDARHLAFKDNSFDLVVSSLVLHNIHAATEREQALREIVRVLKPGGRLALIDFGHTGEYVQVLREQGLNDSQRSNLHFQMYPPVRVVTASKPFAAQAQETITVATAH